MREQQKIERFSSYIMSDVTEKKRIIETRVHDKLKKEYDEKELLFLEEAYNIIQTGLKEIDREKNEVISKTLMENKVKLLSKRNEIITTVFDKAKKQLLEYTKTDEYKEDLIRRIIKHKEFMGDGEYTIYLNIKDKAILPEIQAEFKNDNVELENKMIEMIGGVRIHNATSKMYLDDSIAKRLEEEEENFLQYCGIEIEDEVGD